VGEKDTIVFPKVMCPGSLNVDLIFVLNTMYIFDFHSFILFRESNILPPRIEIEFSKLKFKNDHRDQSMHLA